VTVKLQFTRFENETVVVTQNGEENRVSALLLGRVPINVKIGGIATGGTILQHVPPPAILYRPDCHMVGNNIENLSESPPLKAFTEFPMRLPVTEFVVYLVMVDDIVSVGATRRGLQIG
jgi:hypothetical protein